MEMMKRTGMMMNLWVRTVCLCDSFSKWHCFSAVRVHEPEQRQCEVEWQGCRIQGSDPLTYILQLQRPHTADHEYKQVGAVLYSNQLIWCNGSAARQTDCSSTVSKTFKWLTLLVPLSAGCRSGGESL